MEGFWPIFFLGVILKIPVAAAFLLVWYAVRCAPETDDLPDEGDHRFRRWRPEPRRPRGPRRGGPHEPAARPLPDCPPGGRFRILTPPAPVRAHQHEAVRDVRRAPTPTER